MNFAGSRPHWRVKDGLDCADWERQLILEKKIGWNTRSLIELLISLQSAYITCDQKIFKFEWSFEIYLSVLNIVRDIFRVPVKIYLFYWLYKAINYFLHYSIKYFKHNNCFSSILNFFCQLMRLFWKDFWRNDQDSIQMLDITKKNSNVHFILGNTGHAWRRLTVNSSWRFKTKVHQILWSHFQTSFVVVISFFYLFVSSLCNTKRCEFVTRVLAEGGGGGGILRLKVKGRCKGVFGVWNSKSSCFTLLPSLKLIRT